MWFNKVSDLFTRAFFEQETKSLTKLISIQTQPVVIAFTFHLKQQPTKNWTAFTWKTSLKWTRQSFAFLCVLKKNSLCTNDFLWWRSNIESYMTMINCSLIMNTAIIVSSCIKILAQYILITFWMQHLFTKLAFGSFSLTAYKFSLLYHSQINQPCCLMFAATPVCAFEVLKQCMSYTFLC